MSVRVVTDFRCLFSSADAKFKMNIKTKFKIVLCLPSAYTSTLRSSYFNSYCNFHGYTIWIDPTYNQFILPVLPKPLRNEKNYEKCVVNVGGTNTTLIKIVEENHVDMLTTRSAHRYNYSLSLNLHARVYTVHTLLYKYLHK